MKSSKFSSLLFSILPLLVLALQGCAPETRPPADPPHSGSCATGRWIGVTAGPSCPPAPGGRGAGWDSRPLFLGANPASALGGYCLYEHDDSTRGDELDRLVRAGDLERVSPDCADVVVAGEMMESLSPDLAEQFGAQAGAVLLPEATSTTAGPVRLAVLDTSPTAEGPPFGGTYKHGASLAYMARELLCQAGEAACAARVTTRLSLPKLLGDLDDPVNGGYFGTKGQLAEAIYGELTSWDPSVEDRLVLNLSLGWIPSPGELGGALEVDAQSVYDALREASCRGVLTVAAVGNLGSGPDAATGPLLPAAWHDAETPEQVQLADGSLTTCVGHDPRASNPLLYPASAVDSRGLALSNHRPGTESARVAFGSHAVTRYPTGNDDDPLAWTGIFTGSSVSTLVVSATAAAAWHYDTTLPRRALMDLLHHSGDVLGREAKVGPGQVRRISLCRGVEAVLGNELCPQAWSPAPPSLDYAAADWKLHDPAETPIAPPGGCPEGEYFHEGGPHLGCPFQKIAGLDLDMDEWAGPQPEDIPCPSCPLIKNPDPDPDSGNLGQLGEDLACESLEGGSYTLYIEIDDAYEGGTLTDATLRIDDRFYLLDLGEEGLDHGDHLEVPCLEGQDIGPESSTADLTFATEKHGSVMNVVPISGGG